MAVDDRVEKEFKKIGVMIHLFPKQKVADIGKLISFRNLLVWEITCLVTPTTSTRLTLYHAK